MSYCALAEQENIAIGLWKIAAMLFGQMNFVYNSFKADGWAHVQGRPYEAMDSACQQGAVQAGDS